MMHAVMRADHWMVGVDFHIPCPPGGGPVPYATLAKMMWVAGDVKDMQQIDTLPVGFDMTRNTDISTLIPHVGPPCLSIAIEIVLSGSKSYFGSYQYLHRDPTGASKPVCAALLGPVNINVNCGTPLCTPTGVVIAPNTHVVGFTWWDIAAGVINAVVDIAIAFAINKFGGQLATKLAHKIGPRLPNKVLPYLHKVMSPLWTKPGAMANAIYRNTIGRLPLSKWPRVAAWYEQKAFEQTWKPYFRDFETQPIESAAGALISYFGGSPIGYDNASKPGNETLYNLITGGDSAVDAAQAAPERASKVADDLFGGPDIEQFE